MANSKYEYVKLFEQQRPLIAQTYIVIRLDGRSFHVYTSHYDFCKPNDPLALGVMNDAARQLMMSFPDIIMAYGDSDEYSFLLRRDTELFNRREEKIVSVLTSAFTAYYQYFWNIAASKEQNLQQVIGECINGETLEFSFKDTGVDQTRFRSQLPALDLAKLPTFDGRAVVYPNAKVVMDYFKWRQVDCHINNLYNTTFWTLVLKGGMTPTEAENRLIGTLSKDKNEILFSQFGINYNNEPEMFKKGTVLIREIVTNTSIGDNSHGEPLSDRQQQRLQKKLKKSPINTLHTDIVKDSFWDQREHLFV
ncbi:tRNA guanylyltransferase [Martiniozyma asiatica (nom. inval.)]|nr:tRNA guanylyltransferase [Martiniozyma asiatica]